MRKTRLTLAAAIFALGLGVSACGTKNASETSTAETTAQTSERVEESTSSAVEAVASGDETVAHSEVAVGLEPMYASSLVDGTYSVTVDSSSSMFRVTDCELTVLDGKMTAVMTMSGSGYEKLYLGTGEEAAKASEEDYIYGEENADGATIFTVPVEALDQAMDCSAFSKRKEKWYDRQLAFRSDSLPAEAFSEANTVTAESLGLTDGVYTVDVTLSGGSGKASVQSPAKLRVEEGNAFVTLVWSSANYDYMKVDEVKYEWNGDEEFSTFEIPVAAFDRKLAIIADTVAMSEPHEISYSLTLDSASIAKE